MFEYAGDMEALLEIPPVEQEYSFDPKKPGIFPAFLS